MRGVVSLLLLTSLSCLPGRWSLKMRGVEVPPIKRQGEVAVLRCLYDMEGDQLYSVSWSKDGTQFYRYMPSTSKPKMTFPGVSGTDVSVKDSDEVIVKLTSLSVHSSGEYRCDATTEAPIFNKVSDAASMLVVAPPQSDPVISGFEEDRWAPGETLELNCTSAKSSPAARLHWSVHGRLIEGDLLTPYPSESDDDGLSTSTLGLSLHLRPVLFSKGPVRVACTSTISSNVSSSEGNSSSSSLMEPLYSSVVSIQVGSGVGAARPGTPLLLLLLAAAVAVCTVTAHGRPSGT